LATNQIGVKKAEVFIPSRQVTIEQKNQRETSQGGCFGVGGFSKGICKFPQLSCIKLGLLEKKGSGRLWELNSASMNSGGPRLIEVTKRQENRMCQSNTTLPRVKKKKGSMSSLYFVVPAEGRKLLHYREKPGNSRQRKKKKKTRCGLETHKSIKTRRNVNKKT